MQDLIGLLGYVVALVATVAAWVFWRQSAELNVQNSDLQRSRDEMALAAKDVRQELDQFKDRLEKSQAELRKAKEQLARERSDAKSAATDRGGAVTALQESLARAERKADNFEAQCESLLKQTRMAEQLRGEAEKKFNELSQDFDRKTQAARENAENRNGQLRQELHQIKQDFEALRTRASQLEEMTKQASPDDVKRLRRKVGNLEHLLMSMRGLKEMAEERNQNWEMALRILSTATLKSRGTVFSGDQLGKLVGAALEAVGDTLVKDEWSGGSPVGHAVDAGEPIVS